MDAIDKLGKQIAVAYLREFNKSRAQAIANKLRIQRDQELEQILNKLKAQGVNYQDLKDRLGSEIKTIEDLRNLTTTSKRDVEKEIRKDAPIVFKNENWFVVKPETRAASCKYGASTRWCTAGDKDNQFLPYKNAGITLYYIIDRTLTQPKEYSKLAVAVTRGNRFSSNTQYECYDADGDFITFSEILRLTNIPRNVFVPVKFEPSQFDILMADADSSLVQASPGVYNADNINIVSLYENGVLPVKLGKITGNIEVYPKKSNLKSLKNFPDYVGGDLVINGMGLTSLKECPTKLVGENFEAANNLITDLEGAPEKVIGDLHLINNPKLISLKGLPLTTKSAIVQVYNCDLRDLNYFPKKCSSFDVSRNPKLTKEHFMILAKRKPEIGEIVISASNFTGEELGEIDAAFEAIGVEVVQEH